MKKGKFNGLALSLVAAGCGAQTDSSPESQAKIPSAQSILTQARGCIMSNPKKIDMLSQIQALATLEGASEAELDARIAKIGQVVEQLSAVNSLAICNW